MTDIVETEPPKHEWVCLSHGPVASADSAHCPTCGLALFDLRNQVDLETVQASGYLHRDSQTQLAQVIALPAAAIVALVLALTVPTRVPLRGLFILMALVLTVAIRRALRARDSPQERALETSADLAARQLEKEMSDASSQRDATPRRSPPPWPRQLQTAQVRRASGPKVRRGSGPEVVAILLAALWILTDGGSPRTLASWVAIPDRIRAGRDLENLFLTGLVHANFGHLLLNCIGLVVLGRLVDLRIGQFRCILLMVATSIAGTLFHCLLTSHPSTGVVGFSGADYGLFGATLALMPAGRMIINTGAPIPLPNFLGVPLVMILFTLLDAFGHGSVAWLGHVGGFAMGVALGLMMRRLPEPSDFKAALDRQEATINQLR